MRRNRVKYRRQATQTSVIVDITIRETTLVRAAEQLYLPLRRARKALIPSFSLDETMAPTNKDSGSTRMAGAHMFQAVQHQELDTLGLVANRDFLKKRARDLRLVAQNNKAGGVNVTPITVVASIDPELLENLIDMEEIDAESVDDYTDYRKASWNIFSLRKRDLCLSRPSMSRPKCWRRCRLQCQRRIPRYASQRQFLTTVRCTGT
jgi:hypothetical protein